MEGLHLIGSAVALGKVFAIGTSSRGQSLFSHPIETIQRSHNCTGG
jgi:hypothetical protein